MRPGPAQSSSSATVRLPFTDRSSAAAPSTVSGAPVSIAGDPFITLPPSVPTWRVDGEPTSADASAIAVYDPTMTGSVISSACDIKAPTRTPALSSSTPPSSSMRSMATRSAGSAALPCRAPTTRSVPPAIGRAPAPRATSASSTVVAMVKLTTTSLRSSSRPVRRSSVAGARACPPASQHRWRSPQRSGRSGPRPNPWPRTARRSDPGSR